MSDDELQKVNYTGKNTADNSRDRMDSNGSSQRPSAKMREQSAKEHLIDTENMARDGMAQIHVNAYSVGHYFNDLCACMWFVYLTWYLINIVHLSNNLAGLCVLSGQIADGICTPITGVFSDKFDTKCGKRFPWYVIGSFIVFPCFMGIWSYPPFVNTMTDGKIDNESFQTAWYVTLPALFNVGWAMVQISHMAIVNSLTNSSRKRDKMVNQRNGFTYAANITVLSAALIVFNFVDSGINQFRILLLMSLILGTSTTSFFMCTIREPKLAQLATELEKEYKIKTMGQEAFDIEQEARDRENLGTGGKSPSEWLKEGTFYVHGMVYMVVRIAVNVTMTVQPFYLQKSLLFKSDSSSPSPIEIAAVPLGSYITSLIFSVYLQGPMTRCLRNRMYPMVVAIVIIIATSVPLIYLPDEGTGRLLVYPLVALQGVGLAIMLNTATSLISDVIGSDANGAFVYGVYSLFDKFANGFLLYYIVATYPDDQSALRYIIGISPIICAVIAYLLTYIGQKYFSHKLAKITGIKQAIK